MAIIARNKMTDIEEAGTTVYNQAIKFGNELYVIKIVRIERIAKYSKFIQYCAKLNIYKSTQ